MRTSIILLMCMIISIITSGQDFKNLIKETEVTPPKFTGVENVLKIENGEEMKSINQYLIENLKYPNKKGLWNEGTEVIQFIVTPNGEITDFTVINSISPAVDKEIIRVLKTTNGMWKPGYNNGKPTAMEKEIALALKTGETEHLASMRDFTKIAECCFKSGNKKLLEKKKPKKALKCYNQGIRYMPYEQSLFYARALCKYELGDIEGARNDWTRFKVLHRKEVEPPALFTEDFKKLKGYWALTNMP